MRGNEERVEAMMEQVMRMMKTFMGEGAIGGVASATGKGMLVEEKVKASDNGKGSDSDSNSGSEVKGTRHSKDEQKCDRNNEKKGKNNMKREKKKGQDESEDDHEWVKMVSKKRARKNIIKDSSKSVELDFLYSSKEVGNKKEVSSDECSENERDVCKTVFMREVLQCERFNDHSSRDVYEFFKEYERYCQDKYGDKIAEDYELDRCMPPVAAGA
ncbi:uncharacterized protein [Palaemon carinicauda]|uniref:uncharacterized protein n=1 Tax=Palaemon carinicauda TaxID=392227 RepID=UPI0035B66DAE